MAKTCLHLSRKAKSGAEGLRGLKNLSCTQLYLTSIPGMKQSIIKGMRTPVEKCDKELDWTLVFTKQAKTDWMVLMYHPANFIRGFGFCP